LLDPAVGDDLLHDIYTFVNSRVSIVPNETTVALDEVLTGGVKLASNVKANVSRTKLSKVSNLKTQHNYIVEFSNGDKEEITINTPEDYFKVKNWVVAGRRTGVD
jgi:hypothetical protein